MRDPHGRDRLSTFAYMQHQPAISQAGVHIKSNAVF